MGSRKSQIETRARLDAELVEQAYVDLGTSVRSSRHGMQRSLDDVAQMDAAACACLDYLGVTPGVVPEGVSDLDERLEYLCRPSGTMRRTVTLDKGWEGRSFGTLLARLDSGEMVALIPSTLGRYKMLDAATGAKHHVSRKVAEHIGGQATFFYRPLPNRVLGMRDLLRYMLSCFEMGDYLRVLIAALVATLVGLLPTWANNLVFGTVIPSGNLKYVLPVACLLVGVVVSRVLVESCRNLVMARLTTKLSVLCGAATYARVLMLPPSFFKGYESGNLYTRVSQVSALTQLIASLLLGSGLTSLLSLIYLVQIWAYAPALAVPAFLTVLVQVLLTLVVTFVNARAVCGNRKIIVLDEATSALDNVTQKQVTESLEQLGCTRVVVAHRLSTVRHCDRILVLDGGRIAEEGTYDELMDRNGIFAELVARQRIEDA